MRITSKSPLGISAGRILVAVTLLAALMPFGGHAQEWPSRPITLVMPYSAGGSTDLYGRALAEFVRRTYGYTLVVENKPGAGGLIAINTVKQAAPDGYTLGYFGATGAVALKFINKEIRIGRDVQAVGQIGSTAVVTMVNPNINPSKSLEELIAYFRAHPGTTYTTVGIGSMSHMLMTAYARANKLDVVHVPYKGGAPASLALLAGEVGVGIGLDPQSTMPHINGGKFVALAYSGRHRYRGLPSVPTVYELGIPELSVESFSGIVAPMGVPESILLKLEEIVEAATKDPAFVERVEAGGADVAFAGRAAFTEKLNDVAERFGKIIGENDIKPE